MKIGHTGSLGIYPQPDNGIKAGFTGTQQGMTDIQQRVLSAILKRLGAGEFHHGDCVGADAEAHAVVYKLGLFIVIHPPKDSKKRAFCYSLKTTILCPKDYLDRNHDIVDETDFLIATPKTKDEELRSGTWATVRYARKIGKRVHIIYPDGYERIERNKNDC